MTKTTFLALFSPFFYRLPLDTAKFKHCSMRQSKVRVENAPHARDLVVNHLGCDIWDMRKFFFYLKKYSQFHRLNLQYIFPFIDCLLLLFNVFYHWSDRESATAAAFAVTCCRVAMWTSRTEAVVYVVKRRSLWFSDDSE